LLGVKQSTPANTNVDELLSGAYLAYGKALEFG
jgi:hypothetical protein